MKKLVLIASIALIAAGCAKQAPAPAPSQNDNNNTQTEQTQHYTTTYRSGYEGDFDDITIALDYLPSKFSVSKNTSNEVVIKELATSKSSKVKFFWNGAAGFTSSTDLWNNTKPCADCKKIANNISIAGAADQVTYENANTEYVVYAKDRGFVVLTLQKPLDQIMSVVDSIKVTTVRVK